MDESQRTISYHPQEGMIKYVTDQLEGHTEEQSKATGTLIQPPPSKKDKIQITRSPCKKPTIEIVLPHIPIGVQAGPDLLVHIGNKYLDHDVTN
jgi:hypothetical protein